MSPSAPAHTRLRTSRRARRDGEPFPLRRRERNRLPVERERSGVSTLALVALATLAGAVARLLMTHGLSLEEITLVDQAHLTFGGLITRLARHGVHPPLVPVLEWCIVRTLGDGELAVRLPALVAGIALVPAVAWLARELFDRRTATIAAALAAVMPVLVWYSQDASGYELVALFGTLALTGAVRAGRGGDARDWALHAVAASLAVWADWSGAFVVLATELVLMITVLDTSHSPSERRRLLIGWGLGTLALACQLAVLGLLFASQLTHAGGLSGVATVSATGVTFYTVVSNVSWALFGFPPSAVTTGFSAVWPLGMLASLVLIGRGVSRSGWLLLLGALVVALATLLLGIAVPGAFDVRYALAAVPPITILFAALASTWPRSQLGRMLVVLTLLALLTGALVVQQLDPQNPRRYDYTQALGPVTREVHRGDAVLYEPADLGIVLRHDAPTLHAAPLTTRLPTRAQAGNVFVITSFTGQGALRRLLDRELGALRATRRLVRHRSYPGVQVWWFR